MKIPRDGGMFKINFETLVIPLKTVKLFTQIGFNKFPFTCILNRLLGPCFKTGPKGIPNETVVDRAHNSFQLIE